MPIAEPAKVSIKPLSENIVIFCRILDVIREDLNEEEVQNLDLVRFRVKTPFFLLMGRKSSNASN